MTHPFLLPNALKRGDLIRVIAPAGAFDRALFWRGVGWLAQSFRVSFPRSMLSQRGISAGPWQLRLQDLNQALRCPEARAVWCVRGGYGAGEVSALADYQSLRRHPKWLIGFSDITALHLELGRRRIASLHAPNITGVGVGWQALRERTLLTLRDPTATRTFDGLESLYPGTARGPLMGGNLTLLHEAAATQRLKLPAAAVLFIEEVNEAPYRVARLLNALCNMRVFDSVSGVVFGQLSQEHAGKDPRYREIVTQFTQGLRLPALWGLPCGHHLRENQPLVLGARVSLAGTQLTQNPETD